LLLDALAAFFSLFENLFFCYSKMVSRDTQTQALNDQMQGQCLKKNAVGGATHLLPRPAAPMLLELNAEFESDV
jgi:hypothetical protein